MNEGVKEEMNDALIQMNLVFSTHIFPSVHVNKTDVVISAKKSTINIVSCSCKSLIKFNTLVYE